MTDAKLRAPNPPVTPPTFPPPQRTTPVTQKDFRHEHTWEGLGPGKGQRCKGCGTVKS
jgi:hypothetical protein